MEFEPKTLKYKNYRYTKKSGILNIKKAGVLLIEAEERIGNSMSYQERVKLNAIKEDLIALYTSVKGKLNDRND